MAGVSPKDIDMLSLYDAFTITPILFLEDLGFCEIALAHGNGGSLSSECTVIFGGASTI